jgi:tetratricopeptide (TPR) repeat protein
MFVITTIIAGCYAVKTYTQNFTWKNEVVYWQEIVQKNPDNLVANFKLALAYQLKEDLDQSILSYEKTLAIKPDYPTALHNLGNIYHYRGDFDQAIKLYQRALAIDPSLRETQSNISICHQLLADQQLSQNQTYKAYKHLLMALKHNPGNTQASLALNSLCRQNPKVCDQ